MKLLYSIIFFVASCPLAISQYCMSGGPSQTADSNIESVTLIGESGGINYTGCPGVLGVELFTAQTTTIAQGNTYTLNVQFGTCQGNYAGAGQAWIDFNQNGSFESGETIGTWSGSIPTAPSAFNFTVPGTAILGSTRMRIMQYESGSLPLDPCSSFTWGSVTDFIVAISVGANCASYDGDDMSDAILVTNYPYTHNNSNAVCYSDQNPIYASPDVFYKVIIQPSNPYINASLCGSQFDTYITVMEPNGTVIAGNDDAAACSPQSEIEFYGGGHSYLYVVVEGWGTETGDYTLTINSNSVGLNELDFSNIRISPNPAQSSITFNNEIPGEITIYDAQGQNKLETTIPVNGQIDIVHLVGGIYLAKFTTERSSQTIKFIKQ